MELETVPGEETKKVAVKAKPAAPGGKYADIENGIGYDFWKVVSEGSDALKPKYPMTDSGLSALQGEDTNESGGDN